MDEDHVKDGAGGDGEDGAAPPGVQAGDGERGDDFGDAVGIFREGNALQAEDDEHRHDGIRQHVAEVFYKFRRFGFAVKDYERAKAQERRYGGDDGDDKYGIEIIHAVPPSRKSACRG